jgi:hypothetical protein
MEITYGAMTEASSIQGAKTGDANKNVMQNGCVMLCGLSHCIIGPCITEKLL